MIIELLTLFALTSAPKPDREVAPAPPEQLAPVQTTLAWELPLLEQPERSIQADSDGETALLLLAGTKGLEARSAVDGSEVWRRADLDAEGLQFGEPIRGAWGSWLGWAGPREGPDFWLEVLSVADGTPVFRVPVEERPVGPPLPTPARAGDRPYWNVPVEGDRVLVFDGEGKQVSSTKLDDLIWSPLMNLGGRVLVSIGPEYRSEILGQQRRGLRRGVGVEPLLSATRGPWLISGAGRRLTAWKCREKRSGTLRCRRRWRQPLGGEMLAPALVSEDLVIGAGQDSFLHAFDLSSGHLRWRKSTGYRLSGTPMFWDDLVAVSVRESARVLFFQVSDGLSAGTIRGGARESFPAGMARHGSRLFVPVVISPGNKVLLRAYEITRE